MVVGFDLRNEIRPSNLGFPDWGSGNPATDWSIAAEKGARIVMESNNNMLIIISGLYFSIFLCDLSRNPIHEHQDLRGKVVYTVHEYPWQNYHLLWSEIYAFFLSTVALFFIVFWLILLVNWRCPQKLPWCCKRQRSPRGITKCELVSMALLIAVALATTTLTETFVNSCHIIGLNVSIFLSALSFLCLCMGLLLLIRISLALWLRAGTVRESAVAVEQEMSSAFAARNSSGSPRTCETGSAENAIDTSAIYPARPMRSCQCLAAFFMTFLLSWMLYAGSTYRSYEAFEAELDGRWGYLQGHHGHSYGKSRSSMMAPVWLGEFGTNSNSLWWNHITRYLTERDLDWAYWSFNGQRTNNISESYGIMKEDCNTTRQEWKLRELQNLLHHEELRGFYE